MGGTSLSRCAALPWRMRLRQWIPSGALQSGENDAVDGDAYEEERAGRGVVDGGAVVVLEEAELDGTRRA